MGELFEQIYDFRNLYQAYRLTARGKRSKSEAIRFELELASNLCSLQQALADRTYRVAGYHRFMIHDPKTREIQALSFRDRVVQHSLCDNVLRPYFDKRLIYDCAACRLGKGTHFALDRLTTFLRAFYREHGTDGYILKMDVKKYFDSVDHAVLKQKLRSFPDKEVLRLLDLIIDSYHVAGSDATPRGLPMGNQSSQWFALYYLDGVDRMIKERYRIRYYTRYMDDLVLVHEDKAYLRSILNALTHYAKEELHLQFNEKTQIFPVSAGVDYLGWHFYLTDSGKVIRRLRTSSKRRWKRRLKAYQKQYSAGEKPLEEITRSVASYNGHLRHGHTWKLKKHVFGKFVLSRSKKD